jgi:hypothetical protein
VNSVLKEQGNPLRIGGDPVAVQSAEPVEKKKKTEEKDDKADKASDDKAKKK